MADDGPFDGALGARQGKRERCRGAAEIQFLTERQKEHREAVTMQARAEQAHRRGSADHMPAVEKAGELFEHLIKKKDKLKMKKGELRLEN